MQTPGLGANFAFTLLDSLEAQVAVVDATGWIVAVNAAWRQLAQCHGLGADLACEGVNYFDVCNIATGDGQEHTSEFVEAAREMIAGSRDHYQAEYRCDSPEATRWFMVKVNRIFHEDRPHLVIIHEEITTRKHTEHELQVSNARIKAIIDSALDGIIVSDAGGNIIEWNPAAETIFGYLASEVIGRNMTDLIVPAEFRAAKQRGLAHFAQTADGPAIGRTLELQATCKNGTVIPIELSLAAYTSFGQNYAVGVVRDISQRRAEDQKLANYSELLEQIVSNIPYYVFWKDRELNYLGCNHNFADSAGLNHPREIVGKSDFDLPWGATNAEWYRQCDREVIEDGTALSNIEESQVRADGTQVLLLTSKVPLHDDEGEVFGILGMYTDITEQKTAETNLSNALTAATNRQRELEGLLVAAHAVLKHESFIDAAKEIFATCKRLVGATSGYVALLSDKGDENEVLFLDSGTDTCSVDPTLPMPIRGLRAEAYRNKSPVYDNAYDSSPWVELMPEGHVPLQNVLFAPLNLDTNCVGLLGLGNKPGGFTDEDAVIAKAFSELAAVALRNTRNIDLLRASETRWSNLVRSIPDGILHIDESDNITHANPAAWKILGVPNDVLLGHTLGSLKLFSSETLDEINDTLGIIRSTKRVSRITVEFERSDGHTVIIEIAALAVREIKGQQVILVFRDVTQRERATRRIQLLMKALQASTEAIVITDKTGRIEWVNDAFERLTGYSADEAVGQTPSVLKSERHSSEFYNHMWRTISSGQVWSGRLQNRRRNGDIYNERMTITPVYLDDESITHYVAIKADISSELAQESQRLQNQKLESIGQLAAGIAHEINTPTQYVSDNIHFLQQSAADLVRGVEFCRSLLQDSDAPAINERSAALEHALNELDFDFVAEEVPKCIEQSLEGLERVTRIVRAMKDFSHPGADDRVPADLNRAIESTVTVARNEWKYTAEMTLELSPDLPHVPVALGAFNQVILNLVVNAAHAIEEKLGRNTGQKGRITIVTQLIDGWAEIRVSDTGCGIKPEHREKVFEHFFTTKAVGKGTGQGLAVTRSSIVDQHGGTIDFDSTAGEGTTFIVRLPVQELESHPRPMETTL